MLYCFPDTNIFMQFKTFDEIAWTDLLGSKEVQIVVVLDVIKELDKHKKDRRKKDRAQKIIKKLKYYEADPSIRDGISLLILTTQPDFSWLRDNNFDPENVDSRIIGTAKWFLRNHQDIEIATLSDDYNFYLQSKAVGIECRTIPEKFRLAYEPDPLEKENQELRRKLNTRPKLIFGFLQKDNSIGHEIRFHIDFKHEKPSEEHLDQIIETMRNDLEYPEPDDTSDGPEPLIRQSGLVDFVDHLGITPPSRRAIKHYNSVQVEEYLRQYREYLNKKHDFGVYVSQTGSVTFVLKNAGTSPADDIDIVLHFPDGLQISSRVRSEPKNPTAPQKPTARNPLIDSIRSISSYNNLPSIGPTPNYDRRFYDTPKPSGPTIRKTNSYEVKDTLDRLKQHLSWKWDPLHLTFGSPAHLPTGIEVEYKVSAANMPDLLEGSLVIYLE